MTTAPLLSICIPTYNRAHVLEKTLQSIVHNPSLLLHDIEVVISDNCSTDATYDMCSRYAERFPETIFYHRTTHNIGGDYNFYHVLSLARGAFLKLNNDKCSFLPHTLSSLLTYIKDNLDENYLLFFPNKLKHIQEPMFICNSLNDFVRHVSYLATWIGAFSLWRNDFIAIQDFTRASKLQLMQTDILYRLLASGRKIKVYNENFFSNLKTQDKIAYNPSAVFGTNYMSLLQGYLAHEGGGVLTYDVYEREKYRVLFRLIGPLCHEAQTPFADIVAHCKPIYHRHGYFYLWLILYLLNTGLYFCLSPFKPLYIPFYLRYKIVLYTILNNKKKVEKYRSRLLACKFYSEGNI